MRGSIRTHSRTGGCDPLSVSQVPRQSMHTAPKHKVLHAETPAGTWCDIEVVCEPQIMTICWVVYINCRMHTTCAQTLTPMRPVGANVLCDGAAATDDETRASISGGFATVSTTVVRGPRVPSSGATVPAILCCSISRSCCNTSLQKIEILLNARGHVRLSPYVNRLGLFPMCCWLWQLLVPKRQHASMLPFRHSEYDTSRSGEQA